MPDHNESEQRPISQRREALIITVAHALHTTTSHRDYPAYDEVACGGGGFHHCEAGHEHGRRGICWCCEPMAAAIVDGVLLPDMRVAWGEGYAAGHQTGRAEGENDSSNVYVEPPQFDNPYRPDGGAS